MKRYPKRSSIDMSIDFMNQKIPAAAQPEAVKTGLGIF